MNLETTLKLMTEYLDDFYFRDTDLSMKKMDENLIRFCDFKCDGKAKGLLNIGNVNS